jgi:hypothetical protein
MRIAGPLLLLAAAIELLLVRNVTGKCEGAEGCAANALGVMILRPFAIGIVLIAITVLVMEAAKHFKKR